MERGRSPTLALLRAHLSVRYRFKFGASFLKVLIRRRRKRRQ